MKKDRPQFTVEHYLAMERTSLERHEFLDGVIYDMAGESEAHGDISVNIVGLLFAQLKGGPCRARTKDTRVRSGPDASSPYSARALYSYPDIAVVCGEPEYADSRKDILVNPKVVIEVLSPSTEAFDRGAKFARYQENATLTDYVLVSQTAPIVEVFTRQADIWTYRRLVGLDEAVDLPSIGARLSLRDIYDRVVFSPELIDPATVTP